ncbi:tetratricopeptide repeat protein [Micromonospora sp. FIMYZ51]|uniref:tetratricopeptide repeat protein n=1 Tax=Micromonospora sp. FIMYZ51 TaxID=3051832 RepID=UPI00311D2BC3
MHWAHRDRPLFPDGQLYVNLRGYDPQRPVTAGDVLARFLNALGVTGEAVPLDPDERAARYRTEISGRRMLLILDNAASVEQVRPLLPGTPSCAVVVTSRDSLAGLVALHGAGRLVLDPLPLPDAVTLLHELIGPRADAQPAAAVALAGLCAQLPLALRLAAELAASRNPIALTDLVAELGDRQRRLRLLDAGGDPRAAVGAVFSWSYQHLAADTARAFRLLGRHPGPEIETYAVAALTGAPLDRADDLLDQLARAHLVQHLGLRRYGMHELLRAYAADLARAEESEAAQTEALSRLLDYYLATAAIAMDMLYPAERHHRPRIVVPAGAPLPAFAEPALARAWLDAERPTLVAVSGYAADHGWPAHTVRLAATLYRYLESGHHSDALTIHARALHAARIADDLPGQAHALTNLGAVHRLLGGYERATDHLRQALTLHKLTEDSYGTARTLSNLGIVDDRLGRHESAARHQRQALVLFRAIEDRYGEAGALTNLGSVEESLGRHESAAQYHRQAYTLFGALGDPVGEAIALANLGDVETRLARYASAAEHLGQALTLFRTAGHRYGEAIALANLGQAEARLGWYGRAVDHLGQALTLFRAAGHRYGEASVLNALGEVMHATGRPDDALARHTAALRIATETGDRDEQLRAQCGLDLIGPIAAETPHDRAPVPEGRADPSSVPAVRRVV